MRTQNLDQLIEGYARVGAINRRRFATLRQVLVRFHEAGLDCMLLKGADLILGLYRVMWMRPMADVDLLVHNTDLPRIERILTELGYRQQIDGNPMYFRHDQTLALDIITEIWYLDSLEGIWQRAVRREFEGVPTKGMGPNDLLLYLTAYVVVHRGCLSPTFAQDLTLLVEKEALDWSFILDEADRHHLRVPLCHGLSYVARQNRGRIPEEVINHLAPKGPTEKLLHFVLNAFVTEKQIPGLGHLLLIVTQPGLKGWRRLTNSLFPSEDFLRYRYGSQWEAQPLGTRLWRPFYMAAQALLLTLRLMRALFTGSRQPRDGPAALTVRPPQA